MHEPTQIQSAERPLKRRKTALRDHSQVGRASSPVPVDDQDLDTSPRHVAKQVAFDDSGSSDGSDFDWQEVDLEDEQVELDSAPEDVGIKDVSVVLGVDKPIKKPSTPTRRKPVSAVEKKMRLEIHKMHIICQFAHLHRRNMWCNDESLHVRSPAQACLCELAL